MKSTSQLDLHGFTTEEATEAIDRFLATMTAQNLKRGKIITGKGTGKIQSVTVSYLKRAGFTWEYEKLPNGNDNTGVLIVFGD